EVKAFCGLEVEDKLKFCREDDGQVGGFLAVQNTADIDALLMMTLGLAGAIARETAGGRALPPRREYRKPMLQCQRGNLIDVAAEEDIRGKQGGASALLAECRECCVELANRGRWRDNQVLAKGASCRVRVGGVRVGV